MLLAKYYIKDKELLQQLECDFCHEVNYQLLMCSSRCHKQYCKDCFKMLRYRECNFCGEGLKGVYLPLKEVQFFCRSQQCKAILHSPQEFDRHGNQCKQLSNEIRQEFRCKANYLCSKGHKLENELGGATCCICLQQYYTSGCRMCRERFCTNCRPPPCSKRQCPIGHELEEGNDWGSITCDLCAIPIKCLVDRRIFSDRDCDFDVCYACYLKLPQEHPLPSYKQLMQEKETQMEAEQMELLESQQAQQSQESWGSQESL